ncbi:universal stress protein [Egicoccus sp. AB-alg6-2]|uniref:universal stress protein n=1 Tax=Egicoccus sp. AB-alg6-2 TaxID=3242692 RepID=UPI00359CC57F
MRIVVGFLRSPEGRAALQRAVEEARLRDAELLVVHSFRGGPREDEAEVIAYREEFERLERQLSTEGVRYTLREFVRGNAPDEDLLQVAKDEDADLIVIGIRRRSPVGKLVLGSNAQDILLQADCPVLAVKAATES